MPIKNDDTSSLSHTKWNCQYHIVFTPKYRRKAIYGKLRSDIGKYLRRLCEYTTEGKQELMKYMLNAYRVLLTRARPEMLICVPTGNPIKHFQVFMKIVQDYLSFMMVHIII